MAKKDVAKRNKSELEQRFMPTGTATLPHQLIDSVEPLFTEPDSTTADNYYKDFTAPISLPRREDIAVKLGPVNLINNLNEYQSDENLLIFFLGIFIGAVIGIVINWATEKEFVVTPISLMLLAIFTTLAAGSGFWLKRVRDRRKKTQSRLDRLYEE